MKTIFLLMAAVMASEHRAYRSAPLIWAGQRSTTCCRLTEGSSWNLQSNSCLTCPGRHVWTGHQGERYSPPQDGLKNLQLSLTVLTEPHEDQLVQPEDSQWVG